MTVVCNDRFKHVFYMIVWLGKIFLNLYVFKFAHKSKYEITTCNFQCNKVMILQKILLAIIIKHDKLSNCIEIQSI